MKNLKLFLMLVMAFTAISLFSGCGSETTSDKASQTVSDKAKTGPEYTSAYICPMHCKGSGSSKAGTCPACKMDYVVNKDAPKGGHNHGHEGHNHEGHDHSHDGHNHDGHNH